MYKEQAENFAKRAVHFFNLNTKRTKGCDSRGHLNSSWKVDKWYIHTFGNTDPILCGDPVKKDNLQFAAAAPDMIDLIEDLISFQNVLLGLVSDKIKLVESENKYPVGTVLQSRYQPFRTHKIIGFHEGKYYFSYMRHIQDGLSESEITERFIITTDNKKEI